MTIDLTLNDEQTDALAAVVANANATLPDDATPYTPESYFAEALMRAVDSYAATAYEATVKRIGAAAASLSYAGRQALISQIEAQLP
jgi:hypothetical protein